MISVGTGNVIMGGESGQEPNFNLPELTMGSGQDLLPALFVDLPSQIGVRGETIYDGTLYPRNGTQTTQELAGYLAARMSGTYGDSAMLGGIGATPDTVVHRTRLGFNGWRWTGGSPENHVSAIAKVFVVTNLAVNAVINVGNIGTGIKDVGEEIAEAGHDIGNWIGESWDGLFGGEEPDDSCAFDPELKKIAISSFLFSVLLWLVVYFISVAH